MIFFNFGKNWQKYSSNFLDEQKLSQSKSSLINLLGQNQLDNGDFLDIGCGSGIFALAAKSIGASRVTAFDLSRESIEAANQNKTRFGFKDEDVLFFQSSIFDISPDQLGLFDIVYSWGVLHHTGAMYRSIDRAASFVQDNGLFIIAIYNRHWTSGIWRIIKYCYNKSPMFIQKIMEIFFTGIIFIAKLLITGGNPLKKDRGMSFYYDIIDWLGGYPYEYASKDEVVNFCGQCGLSLVKYFPAGVPTGCNQFIFRKQ